ncbi:MAG: M28 family peptidase [Planctomycetota bacterium]|jgi:hypothetical protein
MNMRRTFPAALLLLSGIAIGVPASPSAASEAGMAAAEQVSEASYRDYLDNWLYTHAGDNRGFGAEHDMAVSNIEMLFTLLGYDVVLHPFQYSSTTYYNVVATKTGTVHPTQEYIVGSHLDSVDNPGADDNASGTALILEAARVLAQYDSAYTIRFIAFDREEQGLIGSSAYVADVAGTDILGMVSTDMVAYNLGTNAGTIHGGSGSTNLKNDMAAAVTEYGDGLSPIPAGASGGSDHAPFENAGYEAVLLIEDWGNPYYHTMQDNVDEVGYIDYAYATRMTRSIVGWLVDAAEVDIAVNTLSFTLPSGVPEYMNPNGGTRIRVEVVGLGTEVPDPGTGLLHYDTGSGWQSVPMEVVSPNVYDAILPWADCPDVVSYYFSADSMTAANYTWPRTAPGDSFSSIAAYGLDVSSYEDFEDAPGWTTEVLGATSGQWQLGVPVNDPGWEYDPASDSDGSGNCFLTQNEIGNTDVDAGAVRLTSPNFDMTGGGTLAYDYYLYLTNSAGGLDMMLVEMSNNGGLAWVEVTRHDTSGGLNWRTGEITTADMIAALVPPTTEMKIRFTANDADPQSIVEAGIDALRIQEFDCTDPCPSDVTGNGVVDVQDFLALLAAWGSTSGPADINDDGIVNVADFLQLLAEWGPCP